MCMKITGIASGKIRRRVDRAINGNAVAVRRLRRKPPYQLEPLRRRKFDRQCYEILACDSRVLARLGTLRGIPETRPISSPRHVFAGESARQYDFLVQYVLAFGAIIGPARAFIADAFTGTVSSGARRAAAPAAAPSLHVQEVD